MRNKIKFYAFALAIAPVFSGCGDELILGSGNVVTETRQVEGFTKIQADGMMDVYLEQGPYSLKIEADDNLMQYLTSELKGDKLVISTSNKHLTYERLRFYISAPILNEINSNGAVQINSSRQLGFNDLTIENSGAGKMDLDIQAQNLKIDNSGATNCILRGTVENLAIKMSGAGSIDAENLVAQNAKLNVSGAGTIRTHAVQELDVKISGAAKVSYKGNPNISQRISGAAKVSSIED